MRILRALLMVLILGGTSTTRADPSSDDDVFVERDADGVPIPLDARTTFVLDPDDED